MKIECPIYCNIQPGEEPLESHARDRHAYTRANSLDIGEVRLFNWSPIGLNLGSRQPLSDANLKNVNDDNVTIVNRITAGGAVLITERDFAMTVCIGRDVFGEETKGIRIYSLFNRILRLTLEHFNVHTQRAPETVTAGKAAACFSNVERGELLDDEGRKVFGGVFSGTTRRGYFQQGYVPLSDAPDKLPRYLNRADELTVEQSNLAAFNIDFVDMAETFRTIMYQEHPEWLPY